MANVFIPVILSFSPDTNVFGDGMTISNIVTINGTAEPDTTIRIYDGGSLIGTTITASNGTWAFTTPELNDHEYAFRARSVDDSGDVSDPSEPLAVTILPAITTPPSSTSTRIVIDGRQYEAQNGDRSWSIDAPDAHTLRFEVRSGDRWENDSSTRERSEIGGLAEYSDEEIITITYDFMVESGALNTADWMTMVQFHSSDPVSKPPFAIEMIGEKMAVMLRHDGEDRLLAYQDPANLVRDRYYSIKIEVNFDNDDGGFAKVWRDDVLIVDYHGALGYDDDVYWKEGIHRYEAPERFAINYRNLLLTTRPDGEVIGSLSDTNATANEVADSAANGTLVGITATTSDLDPGSTRFSLVENAGGRFTINAISGVISVADGSRIDFQDSVLHSIIAKAVDASGASIIGSFTIAVTEATGSTILGTKAAETIDEDFSTPTTNGADDIFAKGGDDIIRGLGGDDTIDGGRGNDKIITGGGEDVLVFDDALNAKTNVDTIRDFAVGIDRIELDSSVFNSLGGDGPLSAGQFHSGSAAHDGNDRIIYNPENGKLYYDSNGSGDGGSVRFARLDENLDLSHTDFMIV